MKTVGELLQKARLQKNLSIEDISLRTKITRNYLTAIEANDFKALPPATFTKGFLRNYATNLELDPSIILAIFRRDYDQDERGRIIPRGLTEPIKAPLTIITPTRITVVISGILGVIIAIFFIRQIIIFTQAPPLSITLPAETGQELDTPFRVEGKTHPEASVTINNEPATVNDDGTFYREMELSSGEHTLVIVASSRSGNSRSTQLLVTVKPRMTN